MKQINDYIQEKLYIGKGYDNSSLDMSIEEFLKELENNDIILENIKDEKRNLQGKILYVDSKRFPVMRIKLEDGYFDSWYPDDDKYVLEVLNDPLNVCKKSYEDILDINDDGFKYTRNNAKLLYKIILNHGEIENDETNK